MNPNIIKYLNVIIADQTLLAQKFHNFHWNVVSENFAPLHTLFGDLYDLMSSDIDTLAERIRAMQTKPIASLKECLEASTVQEVLIDVTMTDSAMLIATLSDLEKLIGKVTYLANYCANANADMITNNMLLNMLEVYEKKAWMVRSTIEPTEAE